MLSGVIETAYEDKTDTIRAPKSDDCPDLEVFDYTIDGFIPLEIKTKYGKSGAWRGGAFSKREADYLFVSWVDTPEGIGLYAAHKFVTEDMWRGGNVGNYYATYLDLEDIMDGVPLIGETVKSRTRFHTVPEVF
jgi:hypothetical protein